MKKSFKISVIILTGIIFSSCKQADVSNLSSDDQYKSIDSITICQDDESDSIPKNKVIYKAALESMPDNLEPRIDIHFCKDNLNFPYYFPGKERLIGKPGQTITRIENEQLQPALQTTYSMTYDQRGRIAEYSVSGPSTIYSCGIVYDKQNRIQQISDDWKKINITYNDDHNIERISESDLDGQRNKILKFTYTYAAFLKQ